MTSCFFITLLVIVECRVLYKWHAFKSFLYHLAHLQETYLVLQERMYYHFICCIQHTWRITPFE